MNILTSTFNKNIADAEAKSKKKRAPLRHLSSFGTPLDEDNMIVEKNDDQEHNLTTITSGTGVITAIVTPAPQPIELNNFGQYLILRSRFANDKADKKTLFKRKDDFLKDMNFDLLNGKITKGTYYFDDDAPGMSRKQNQFSETVSLDNTS